MKLGLGTGSTAGHFIDCLGARVKEGWTSSACRPRRRPPARRESLGIALTTLDETPHLDLTVDGADEFDDRLDLIKGGGGALLREKIVAASSRRMIVIADGSKQVKTLGRFPLPVEVVPFGVKATVWQIERALEPGGLPARRRRCGCATARPSSPTTAICIVDCALDRIERARRARRPAVGHSRASSEHGLFIGIATIALIGTPDGVERSGGDPWPYDYDLFVIGAGSGGVRAGRVAAQHGAKVAIAEEYRVGGTCVIRGCVPKKLLVYASRFAEDFEDAARLRLDDPECRLRLAHPHRQQGHRDRPPQQGLYPQSRIGRRRNHPRARRHSRIGHTVRLAGGRTITAETILIATGAAPFVPHHLPGRELAITSNEAFHLEALPRRIAIVGGGYIAVEFAGIFSGLGVETVLIYRGEQILRGFDDDLRHQPGRRDAEKGHRDPHPRRCGGDRAQRRWRPRHPRGRQRFGVGQIMFATGRMPNTGGLGLDKAGVEIDAHDAVKVDGYSRSTAANIYAVGDVTNRVNLTPVAIREGQAFADTVFGGKPTSRSIMTTFPPRYFPSRKSAPSGLTEAEARAKFAEVDIYKTMFRPMKHTFPAAMSER